MCCLPATFRNNFCNRLISLLQYDGKMCVSSLSAPHPSLPRGLHVIHQPMRTVPHVLLILHVLITVPILISPGTHGRWDGASG